MTSPQNVYDDLTFFEGYRALRQNDTGLNGALEIPAFRRLLPDLTGKTILDLGCGFGDFARFACANGAASVTAVDLSQKMIDEASRLTTDPGIRYVRASIEGYTPELGIHDLIVSSLALHYVADFDSVARGVFEALKPGGKFVFSVEHPMCTANPVGWVRDSEGQLLHWPVDRYRDEGPRETRWFIDDVIKHHRSVETYVTTLLTIGFRLDALSEPAPTPEALAVRPDLKGDARRPPFLLLAASRV